GASRALHCLAMSSDKDKEIMWEIATLTYPGINDRNQLIEEGCKNVEKSKQVSLRIPVF
ncbi:hypothetical protein NPIL_689721, partial [Nephila pilipes]